MSQQLILNKILYSKSIICSSIFSIYDCPQEIKYFLKFLYIFFLIIILYYLIFFIKDFFKTSQKILKSIIFFWLCLLFDFSMDLAFCFFSLEFYGRVYQLNQFRALLCVNLAFQIFPFISISNNFADVLCAYQYKSGKVLKYFGNILFFFIFILLIIFIKNLNQNENSQFFFEYWNIFDLSIKFYFLIISIFVLIFSNFSKYVPDNEKKYFLSLSFILSFFYIISFISRKYHESYRLIFWRNPEINNVKGLYIFLIERISGDSTSFFLILLFSKGKEKNFDEEIQENQSEDLLIKDLFE